MSTSLRACGAYEAFVRTYKGLETERGAAEFLLLDRLFPRWTKVPYKPHDDSGFFLRCGTCGHENYEGTSVRPTGIF